MIAVVLVVAGCRSDADGAASGGAAVPQCSDSGRLSGEMYGGIRASFDWRGRDIACEGMPRPDEDGARLRFAGEIDGSRNIAIIIALPGFRPDRPGTEYPANVTVIEEGNGRFFSTPDLDNCLAAIDSVEPAAGDVRYMTVSGALYCIAPLPEVNGESGVSVPELRFVGLLDWGAA